MGSRFASPVSKRKLPIQSWCFRKRRCREPNGKSEVIFYKCAGRKIFVPVRNRNYFYALFCFVTAISFKMHWNTSNWSSNRLHSAFKYKIWGLSRHCVNNVLISVSKTLLLGGNFTGSFKPGQTVSLAKPLCGFLNWPGLVLTGVNGFRLVSSASIRPALCSQPGLYSWSPRTFGWMEPRNVKYWSRSLKFVCGFHSPSLWAKRVVQIIPEY